MLKAFHGYRPGRQQQEGLHDEDELQIEDIPELRSPASLSKAKIAAAGGAGAAGLRSPSRSPSRPQLVAEPMEQELHVYGVAWKLLINILIVIPWSLVLLLSFLLNSWQLLFRPLGGMFWSTIDWLDQRSPALTDAILWAISQVSLTLHVITIGINLGVMAIMWREGYHAAPILIVFFYGLCHYCSAVTMFKELDMREAGDTFFSDLLQLLQRCLDVLFFDIQMAASVVHGNRMLEGMTQLMFKGYEEARVALSTLLFTMPCCVIIGVMYGIFMHGELKTDVRDLRLLTSAQDRLYAALCFTIINSIEKVLRFSVVDPWLHDRGDGFPLLYVRSHAARLPASFIRDWLVRCKVALQGSDGRLVLKELYSHYSQQVKDTSVSLADPHRAYLLRKAMHFFNSRLRHQGPANADLPSSKPIIQELIADEISPGVQLSSMLADILLDASCLVSLSLRGNGLDDAAVAGVMRALQGNEDVQLQTLDLSGNQILAKGAAAVSAVLAHNHSIYSLSLAGCPVRDEGAMTLAEALKTNIALYRLDLSDCQIGPEGAIALAAALKLNPVLSFLNMSGTHIGNTGVEALCKALRSAGSSGLKELDLSHTVIDDRAAAALAGMLSSSRVLERLVLTHTNITDAGAQLMCNALQNNTTLQFVDVTNNMLMDASWQKLLNHVVKGKPRT